MGVGVGVSGVAEVSGVSPLPELLLELLELELLGASPGMSGDSVGKGWAASAAGLGAFGALSAGLLASPGNGNCCAGDEVCGAAAGAQGADAGWFAGHGAGTVWATHAAAERAVAASRSRNGVRGDITL